MIYGYLAKKGYTFRDVVEEEELETYLASIPEVQRQGVKAMLDFLRIHNREGIVKFVKQHFTTKPTKNIVINAIIKYMESDEYQASVIQFEKYIQVKNFYPIGEIERMCRLQEYITTDLVLNERFFKIIKVRCEEELWLRLGIALFRDSELEMDDNFINTALNALANKAFVRIKPVYKESTITYRYSRLDNTGVHLSSKILEDKINVIEDLSFTQKQFIKAVLIFSKSDNRDSANKLVSQYRNKESSMNMIYDACRNYMFSHNFNYAYEEFKQVYENGLNDRYEEVNKALLDAGVKTRNNLNVFNVIANPNRRIPSIPSIFKEVMLIHWSDAEYTMSNVNFLQSLFDVWQSALIGE